METSSPEFLRALVREGGYLTLLPSRLAHAELLTGQWQALDVPGLLWRRPVMAYTRAGEPQSAPLARLLQALRNAQPSHGSVTRPDRLATGVARCRRGHPEHHCPVMPVISGPPRPRIRKV